MTTKPELPKWVTDDSAAKISDPGATKKLAGWSYKEKPPFQFWNWLWNGASKWFLGLQGSYYDIVIGSAAQVTALEATHVLADLVDALAVAGSRVLILDGTHTLLGNLSLTNADLKIKSESPLAILDVSTFTATFSGARNKIFLRVTNSGAGDIIVSGAGSIFGGIDIPIANVTVSNGAVANTSGATGGMKQTEFIGNLTGSSKKVGVLNVTVLPLGTWNMDTSTFHQVAHGIPSAMDKIISVSVSILNNGLTDGYDLNKDMQSSVGTGTAGHSWDVNTINMFRLTSGWFDSPTFTAATGWITIWHID